MALPAGRRPRTSPGAAGSSATVTRRRSAWSPRSTSSSRRCAPGPRLARARTKPAPGGARRRRSSAKTCPKARDKAILVRLSSHAEHLARLKMPPKQADMRAGKAQIRTKRTKVAFGSSATGRRDGRVQRFLTSHRNDLLCCQGLLAAAVLEHRPVDDVGEMTFEAAQGLVPALALGPFTLHVGVRRR